MDVDDLTTRMEFLSTSPPSTADDSSCDDSTGPTTPESISPLLGAARVEDVLETPLDQYLSCLKPSVSKIAAKRLPFNTAQNQKEALFSKPVKHIAVVGAGYVGKHKPPHLKITQDEYPERERMLINVTQAVRLQQSLHCTIPTFKSMYLTRIHAEYDDGTHLISRYMSPVLRI
jgi:uncharacterized protein YdiU (UPF0061 family)